MAEGCCSEPSLPGHREQTQWAASAPFQEAAREKPAPYSHYLLQKVPLLSGHLAFLYPEKHLERVKPPSTEKAALGERLQA